MINVTLDWFIGKIDWFIVSYDSSDKQKQYKQPSRNK